jgi:hypothetical protein
MFKSSHDVMRRTVLLLATLLTGVVVASGIALAETFTCSTNPCAGTAQDDQITGTINPETINGKGGNDQIFALEANDSLNGQAGDDTLNGQLGDDKLNGGFGNDTMDGGGGRDSYRFTDYSFGADLIEADSSGVDTINLSGISNSVTNGIDVDLVGPDPLCAPTHPRCISLGGEFIENLVGTPFRDSLTGNSLKNNIRGGDHDDHLHGANGNDKLQGGNGFDQLFPGAGNDTVNGGEGPEEYEFTSNWGSDTIVDPNTVPSSSSNLLAWFVLDDSAATQPLTINLVSGPSPEVTDGNGNTINWEGNVIARAQGAAGNDVFIQNSSNNVMNGLRGADTYKGYGPGGPASGNDTINDAGGSTGDSTDSYKLDLTNFDLADITKWETIPGSPSTFADRKSLLITYADGSKISFLNYFFLPAGATDVCTSNQGSGYIETIAFADDSNVDLAQVKSLLGCPQ